MRPRKSKVSSAVAKLGSKGGKARAKNMSAERRFDIAKKAYARRWSKINLLLLIFCPTYEGA